MKLLIDNSAYEAMLEWVDALKEFDGRLARRDMVVYLAPETVGEVLAIGATSRKEKLSSIAALILETTNGRQLNYHWWRLLAEVRNQGSPRFLPARLARNTIRQLKTLASGGSLNSPSWFERGAELMRQEKARDQEWRIAFQRIYRDRNRELYADNKSLEYFSRSSTIRGLVQSRLEAICREAGLDDAVDRASVLLGRRFVGMPMLSAHMWLRVARLWWYTEATPEGRRASMDLFDDALLTYLMELDVLVTADKALLGFARAALPQKKVMDPANFEKLFLGK